MGKERWFDTQRQSIRCGLQTSASEAFGDFFLRGHLEQPIAPNLAPKERSASEVFLQETETELRIRHERRVFRKLDYRLLPLLSVFMFFIYLEPRNTANLQYSSVERIGIQQSLGLSDHQYSLALTVKYGYVVVLKVMNASILASGNDSDEIDVMALPWNLLIGRIGAGILLPLLLMFWAGVLLSHAFLDNYAELLAARILLGIFEGGIQPGIILYLSTFYTRGQIQLRIALVFLSACLSSAVSGLLSNQITQMHGIWNLEGWSWVFLLQGSAAALMGLGIIFCLPSTPAKCRFLDEEDKEIIAICLKREGRNLERPDIIKGYQILAAFKSPHVLMTCLCSFMSFAILQSIPHFQPIAIAELNLDPLRSELSSMPPYLVALIFMVITACLSDRYASRGMSVILSATIVLCGLMMSMVFEQSIERYSTLLLIIPGTFGILPALNAWMANNSEPYMRSATSLALMFMCGNAGVILSIWLVDLRDIYGDSRLKLVYIGFSIGLMLCASLTWAWLSFQNNSKGLTRKATLSAYQPNGLSDDLGKSCASVMFLVGWERLGDRHPDFVYSY